MSVIDHDFFETLEYKGDYGARYLCRGCDHFKGDIGADNTTGTCVLLSEPGLKVSRHNNVCRRYKARITNPSNPTFDFDNYLEFLGSEYYRPWNVDTSMQVGEGFGMIGLEATASGGWQGKYGKYPIYKSYAKPYCSINFPRCYVYFGSISFSVDYRLYRNHSFVKDGDIIFITRQWKDKPTQRKYQLEYNGRWSLNGRSQG
ncbi:hypothetical protein NQ117_05375 [Paenibacillus sp. SC116]|uniref:hypothetical protein n=1 Tax=Paenibacillus sp. SC116 TaxID=2968986 RepID=UPI00215B2FA2|nr:hypothetical protein [Paenibacillus sp. SC116]MCR8843103.1 hypothetical protein [Paenibacillus sp. SC116]